MFVSLIRFSSLILVALCCAACDSSTSGPGTGGSAGTGGTAGSAGTGGTSGNGGTAGSGGNGGASGTCGGNDECFQDIGSVCCEANQFCNYGGQCVGAQFGSCADKPVLSSCTDDPTPVCTCYGDLVFPSVCAANAAGYSAAPTSCPTP